MGKTHMEYEQSFERITPLSTLATPTCHLPRMRTRTIKHEKNRSGQKTGRVGSKKIPVQRGAANARERARMRVLSKAFSSLKTSLPWVPKDTKLSKLDTLRLASSYISHLRRILTTGDDNTPLPHIAVLGPQLASDDESSNSASTSHTTSIHPIALTWPYSFGSRCSENHNYTSNQISSSQTKLHSVTSPSSNYSYQTFMQNEPMESFFSSYVQ